VNVGWAQTFSVNGPAPNTSAAALAPASFKNFRRPISLRRETVSTRL
jgi:hypothetical protein